MSLSQSTRDDLKLLREAIARFTLPVKLDQTVATEWGAYSRHIERLGGDRASVGQHRRAIRQLEEVREMIAEVTETLSAASDLIHEIEASQPLVPPVH